MKKLFALILALALLFSLSACGNDEPKETLKPSATKAPVSTPAPTDAQKIVSYSEAYDFYYSLFSDMGDTVSDIVEKNNEKLEKAYPDSYYTNPSYMILMYLPFLSIDMAFTATFDDSTDASALEKSFSLLGIDDASFSKLGSGKYKMSFTSGDSDKPEKIEMFAEYNKSNGGIRFVKLSNGKLDAFNEAISLGGDRYAIQSKTSRAIVTYKNGKITSILHSVNKYEVDYTTNEVSPWSVAYDHDKDSIINKNSLDEKWVLELESSGAFEKVYKLENDTLTISGQKSSYDYNTNTTVFTPFDPIVIKP